MFDVQESLYLTFFVKLMHSIEPVVNLNINNWFYTVNLWQLFYFTCWMCSCTIVEVWLARDVTGNDANFVTPLFRY